MDEPSFDLPALPGRRTLLWLAGGFFVVTFLIYRASLHNQFVKWDDGLLIYQNPIIRQISPASLKAIFTSYDPELYVPLTLFTYQIDYQLSGTQPFVYHLDNLVLHTLNALLVGWLIFLLSRRKSAALVAGLLFAVHPLNTEAVVWAAARKDVLSTVFYLSSIIAYLYYRSTGKPGHYRTSLGLFVLGLLSKVMVITLPVALILIDWRDRRRFNRTMLTDKTPYFIVAVVFGVIALFGKRAVLQEATVGQMALMAAKSTVFYLQKLVWPVHLSVLYPYTNTITLTSPDFFLPTLALLVLVLVAAFTLRWTREIAFGLSFFLVTLLPSFTNLFKAGDAYIASDRYAYIPSIGLFYLAALAAAAAFAFLRRRWQSEPAAIGVAMAIIASIMATLGFKAYQQSLVWKDTESLFRNVLVSYPDSYMAHNNLSDLYRSQSKLDQAMAEAQALLATRPADAHNNIANVLLARHDLDGAAKELQASLAIHPDAKVYNNLGGVYRSKGMIDAAIQEHHQALALDPNSAEAYGGLALIDEQIGKLAEAETFYRKALALRPTYPEVLTNLGELYAQQNKWQAAVEEYQRAIDYSPFLPAAHYNLAVAYAALQKTDDAITEYERAIGIQADYLPARMNLAILYYDLGRTADAKAQFEEILRVDPGNQDAQSALAQIGSLPR